MEHVLRTPAITAILLSSVDSTSAGIASAVLSATHQVGSALGVTAFGVIVLNGLSQVILDGQIGSGNRSVAGVESLRSDVDNFIRWNESSNLLRLQEQSSSWFCSCRFFQR